MTPLVFFSSLPVIVKSVMYTQQNYWSRGWAELIAGTAVVAIGVGSPVACLGADGCRSPSGAAAGTRAAGAGRSPCSRAAVLQSVEP